MYPFCAPIIFFVSLPLQGKGHKRDSSYLCPFFCCEEIKAALIFYLLSFQGILALSFAREKIQRRTKQGIRAIIPFVFLPFCAPIIFLSLAQSFVVSLPLQGIIAICVPSFAREGTQRRTKQAFLIPSREGTQPALQKKGHKWLVSLEGIKAALIIPSFQGILALSLAREGTQQRTKQGIRDTNLALHYLLISRSLVCKIKDKG